MVRTQPMKMAAAEALWNSENPASFSLFTIGNQARLDDVFAIRIPRLLSLLAYNRLDGEVKGIRNLQGEYEEKIWARELCSFGLCCLLDLSHHGGVGFLMFFISVFLLYRLMRNRPIFKWRYAGLFPFVIALPYISNTTGWLLTEMGRQPWVVFGLMKTADAVSPTVSAGMVLASLVVFGVVYGVLMIADIYLLAKYAKAGPEPDEGKKAKPSVTEESYWE